MAKGRAVRVALPRLPNRADANCPTDRSKTLRFQGFITIAALVLLAACAQSSIQPMAQDTFKVATTAAPACGPNGARNVAFRTAAVEVIRRGGDKFVLTGDASNSNFWSGAHDQSIIVRIIPDNSPEARNALSAREQLGANWQELVAKGAPTTCT